MSDEITEDEVRRSIWKLKSGKASGVCGIQGELLKTGSEVQLTQTPMQRFAHHGLRQAYNTSLVCLVMYA